MAGDVEALVAQIAADPGCRLERPSGPPEALAPFELPSDLALFYELCGGTHLFAGADFECVVVAPKDFVRSNPVVLHERFPGDRSESWFVVVTDTASPVVVIDLAPGRRGRCYDAFHDVYGVAGSMSVIANTFTELLDSLLANQGRHWYWLESDWASLGDAYD